MCVFVIKPYYKSGKVVTLVQCPDESLPYEGQLEAEIILMARLQILHQCRHRQLAYIIRVEIAVDGKVHYRHERECIHILFLTHRAYRLVSESQTYPETAQTLQQVVIVFYKRYHLVTRFIHFKTSHRTLLYMYLCCKLTKNL